MDWIFALCSGHLEVLRLLADYLVAHPASPAMPADSDSESFLEQLLEQRLRSLGRMGESVLAALELLAVVGIHISAEEQQCLLAGTPADLGDALARAKEMHLLRDDTKGIRFPHEIVHSLFLRRVDRSHPEVHRLFAACISKLRPADYLTRSRHLALGGDSASATHLRFLAWFSRVRDGEQPEARELEEICGLADLGAAAIYRGLKDAHVAFQDGDPAGALAVLERLPEPITTPALAAERDFLLARCLRRRRSRPDRQFAIAVLDGWRTQSAEFEQWFRLLSLLIVLQMDEGDTVSARTNERRLWQALAERVGFDPFAEHAAHVLRRKWAAIHDAELAIEQCQKAVDFYGPVAGPVFRNPVQLYFALVNLAGNALVIGEFTAAERSAREAIHVIERCPHLRFHGLDKTLNNLALAGMGSAQLSPAEASAFLADVIADDPRPEESILVRNNAAVCQALAGDVVRALRDLEGLAPVASHEDFHHYFVYSNVLTLRAISSGAAVLAEWDALGDRIPRIPSGDMACLRARHALVRDALSQLSGVMTPQDWDAMISRAPGLNFPAAAFYRRGLLLSDIQFFSDS